MLLGPLAGFELGDHLGAARPLAMRVDHAPDRAVDRGLDPHVHPGRQHIEEEARRGLVSLVRRSDPEGVELAGMLGIGAEHDHLRALSDLRQQVEAMIALRVDVNDPGALNERLVLQQLQRHRLAAAERAGQRDRRRPVGLRRLAQIHQHALAPVDRVRHVQPAGGARPRLMGRVRDHRPNLLARERALIPERPRALTRQMLHKQLKLIPQRPVQRMREGLPQRAHPPVQLLQRARRADQRQGSEEQRLAGLREPGMRLPGQLRPPVALIERAVRGLLLVLQLVRGSRDQMRDPPQRLIV